MPLRVTIGTTSALRMVLTHLKFENIGGPINPAPELWSSPLNISVKVKDSRLDLSDRRTQVMRSSSQLYYYPSADHKLAARPMSHGEMAPNNNAHTPAPLTFLAQRKEANHPEPSLDRSMSLQFTLLGRRSPKRTHDVTPSSAMVPKSTTINCIHRSKHKNHKSITAADPFILQTCPIGTWRS